jgi:hypothetical protein
MKIKIFITAALILIGCYNDPLSPNFDNKNKKQDPNRYPLLIQDYNGIVYDCDSTRDWQDEQGNWFKTLYRNGELYLVFPYEYNQKGFKTFSR